MLERFKKYFIGIAVTGDTLGALAGAAWLHFGVGNISNGAGPDPLPSIPKIP